MTSLTIIRGLPGSGKSTLAKKLAAVEGALHYEADMYFVDSTTGLYVFDATKLHKAHWWCLSNVAEALKASKSVIVSNTFTKRKELIPYLDLCEELNIKPTILLCQNSFGSIHDVPEATIKKMAERFQYEL